MDLVNNAIRRAQVYGFLSGAFLYPVEDWTEDAPVLAGILVDLNFDPPELPIQPPGLTELQAAYRRTFGLTGSLCYETEYGLPHEFRQSQEIADLSGFYHAFGFTMGGPVRERPDHVAVELEFMHVLTLKEAYAADQGLAEQVEICTEAQGKFLQNHPGRWLALFVQSLALNARDETYLALARFALAFVKAEMARLGVRVEQEPMAEVQHTPFDPDFSCSSCPVAELAR